MTIPDPSFERSGAHPDNVQDIIPSTERNQDPERTEAMRSLSVDARPLTEDERKAADRDAPAGERVYAPASERVPVEPVPGHRELTEHTDTHTAEREAAGQSTTDTHSSAPSASPAYGTHDDAGWNRTTRSSGLPFGLAWVVVVLGAAGAIGGWLYLRWQRERNRPINRIRRQARQAASEIRERVPSSSEEAVKPAAGLTTALLSILLILLQRAQARSRQTDRDLVRQGKKSGKRADKAVARATQAVSDVDWQKRLTTLKKRWDPTRVELEKVSISRR